MWNFDEEVNREGTCSIKYDAREKVFGRADVIPMWVADMDFRTPPFIIDALRKRLDHEILGYTFRPGSYYDAITGWIYSRHGWKTEKEWIVFCPGVVPALNICTLAYTSPGDAVIIQPPVYTPFHGAVTDHERTLVFNNLSSADGTWEMDTNSLESLITPSVKMIIISNPHNPVGRCWRKEELQHLAEICHRKGIIIISDEIHSDLVLPGHSHIPLASLSPEAASVTVTCMAPSKTFNLAGLSTSSVIISDEGLRKRFTAVLEGLHLHLGNIFGNEASEAAYMNGAKWVDDLNEYVSGNADLFINYCRENIPVIKPVKPEATYMMWLDCRAMGMTGNELHRFFIDSAGVGMNEGSAFGPGGEGFMRINLACPRSRVTSALKQIEKAINEHYDRKQTGSKADA